MKHQLDRLANAGKIPSTKAGRFRVFREEDIPTIRAACIAAGYIQPTVSETPAHV